MEVINRYKKSLVLLGLLLGLNWSAVAQEVMTLPKAIALAIENNYGIKIAEKEISIAENSDTWARAGRAPVITLSANLDNSLTRNNNPASFLQGSFYNGSLGAAASASVIAYAGGRVKIAKQQLGMATRQALLEKESGIHDLIQTVYDQYYAVILQTEQLNLLRQTYQLSARRLDYETLKKEYGSSNSFNIIQFESAMMTDSINISRQKQLININQRTLYNTLNLTEEPDYVFDESLSVEDEQIDKEALKSLLEEENYTIKSLEVLAALNELNSDLARAARKPIISIDAGLGVTENAFKFFGENPNTGQTIDLVFGNQIAGTLGATASWTAYDGGVLSDDVQNALIQEDIDRLSIEEAKANLYRQLDLLVENYENQREQITLSDQQITLAQRNLEITEERFKGGLLSSVDYRNVQLQLLNAYFSKASAIYDLILIKTDIDYLVGKFSN